MGVIFSAFVLLADAEEGHGVSVCAASRGLDEALLQILPPRLARMQTLNASLGVAQLVGRFRLPLCS